MNAWERGEGEPLPDYTRRLEDYINPDPAQARVLVCEWVYRLRQIANEMASHAADSVSVSDSSDPCRRLPL